MGYPSIRSTRTAPGLEPPRRPKSPIRDRSTESAPAPEAAITRATGIPKAPSRPEPKNATLSRSDTSVLVLNGNGIAGAAAAAASRVRARGYSVTGTGNAAQSYGQSVVMYRPGRRPEAKRLGADLGIRLVGPLDGIKLRGLLGAQVVVVLGN
jgi:hypothetical protein